MCIRDSANLRRPARPPPPRWSVLPNRRRPRVGRAASSSRPGSSGRTMPGDGAPGTASTGRLALSGTGLVPRGRGAGSGGVAGASRRRGCPAWTTSDRPSTRPWARCCWPRPGWTGWAPWLAPGDFRDPLGREVYGLLLAMRARSAVIDVVRDDLADRDDPVTRVPPPQLVL